MRYLLTLVILVAFPSNIAAQESTSYTYGDWKVSCQVRENALPCEMSQNLIDSQSNQTIVSFSLAHSPTEKSYAIQIRVPLGVRLEGGMVIKAGETTIEGIRFARCLPNGCLVEAKLEDPLLGDMIKGGEAAIAIVDAAGQAVTLPYSLKGFDLALKQLESKTVEMIGK